MDPNTDTPEVPEAPKPAPARQLDFVSRLRAHTSQLLTVRKELKSLKEEFNETEMASEIDPQVWSGDNPALGAHASISIAHLVAGLNALDLMENLLVEQNQLGPLLRIKE